MPSPNGSPSTPCCPFPTPLRASFESPYRRPHRFSWPISQSDAGAGQPHFRGASGAQSTTGLLSWQKFARRGFALKLPGGIVGHSYWWVTYREYPTADGISSRRIVSHYKSNVRDQV